VSFLQIQKARHEESRRGNRRKRRRGERERREDIPRPISSARIPLIPFSVNRIIQFKPSSW
jgi:hypothetical protein